MRLQLPTPAVPDSPRPEVGGVGPRLKNRLDAEPLVSNGKDDFSSHLRRQRTQTEPVETQEPAAPNDSIGAASDPVSSDDAATSTDSAVPADDSQELPESDTPSLELEEPDVVDEAAVLGPQGVVNPVTPALNPSVSSSERPEVSGTALPGAPKVPALEPGLGSALANDRSGGPIGGTQVAGPGTSPAQSSGETSAIPAEVATDPSRTALTSPQSATGNAAEVGTPTTDQSSERSLRNQVSTRDVPVVTPDRVNGSGRPDVPAEQRSGADAQFSERSARQQGQSEEPVPSRPSRGTPLEALLKAHGAERTSGEPAPAMDPAMSRVREVQQQVNQSNQTSPVHPDQVGSARPAPLPAGAGSAVPAIGIQAGGSDARTTVLGDVLARSGAEAKLAEQTTQLTARGMTALASQRGGSLNIRLNPTSLGEVSIRMTVTEGVVRADLVASSAAARTMLEGGLDVLRGAMESRGLTVDRLVVQAAGEAASTRSESQGQSNQGGAREQAGDGRQDAAGQQSRGRGEGGRDRSDNHESRYSEQGASFMHLMDEEST